jgi:hypothetical protein
MRRPRPPRGCRAFEKKSLLYKIKYKIEGAVIEQVSDFNYFRN